MLLKSKLLIALVLVGVLIGVFGLQKAKTNLYHGQILGQNDKNQKSAQQTRTNQEKLVDLKGKLEFILPKTSGEDLQVKAVITNQGNTILNGANPFKYAIYLENTAVFTNIDSYTILEPGESFDFIYPISKAIYNYSNAGKVTLKVDLENTIAESDETNNEVSGEFTLGNT